MSMVAVTLKDPKAETPEVRAWCDAVAAAIEERVHDHIVDLMVFGTTVYGVVEEP